MLKLGFIGVGNMGGALARAASKKADNEVFLANRHMEKAQTLATEIGAKAAESKELAATVDFIFLGVKPQGLSVLAREIRDVLAKRQSRFVLVSMAAGTTIERISELFGSYPVIRIMPNTPVSVGEGMVLYACSADVTEKEKESFLCAMSEAGRFAPLAEGLIDAGSAVSGCGPAFADLFMEALADGGVACGLPRAAAQEMAAQMLLGSAKLLLDSAKHPGELKDAVCSPGGTTIQGVRILEENGFRGAVMDAVIAAYEKTLKL